jgi:hypothetical protein
MLLDDLKTYLIAQNLATSSEVKFNLADSSDNCVVLWQYGGMKSPTGNLSVINNIQVKVLDVDMGVCETRINAIFNSLVDEIPFKQLTTTRKANVFANQPPFYVGRDEQGRYAYVFNLTIVTGR